VLAVLSCMLLAIAGANVNSLVPFYAIGVFTAFTMAGFGMARYYHRVREPGWRRRMAICFSAGVTSLVVVVVFIVVKFSEGAWLVVLLFAVGVPALIRLNREYRLEAEVLEHIGSRGKGSPDPPTYARRTVFVFVDDCDLATLAALRYARSLRPTTLRAVHFSIDSAQDALLRRDWLRASTGVVLDFVDCPDRRLARAAAELVSAEACLPGVGVTAILPRRGYSALLGRLLHDRTADRIAGVVSQIPHSAATIVPFDVRSRVQVIQHRRAQEAAEPAVHPAGPQTASPAAAPATADHPAAAPARDRDGSDYSKPVPPPGVNPIGTLTKPGRAGIEGRVRAVEIRPVERNTVLACEIADSTGQLTALFYGRSHIAGLDPGARVRLRGSVGTRDGRAIMVNPAYELLAAGPGGSAGT
jgi:hypothetical protein